MIDKRTPSWPTVLRSSCLILILLVASSASAQPCGGPPTAPRALRASLGGAILRITWKKPAQGEPAKYRIQAGTSPGRANVANLVTQTNTTSFATPVSRGTYYLRVRAVSRCGSGPFSNQVQITRRTGAAPGVPNPKVQASTRVVTKDFFGDVMIIGEVQNAWLAGMAIFIEINADFFGAGGRFIGTDSTFVRGMGRRLSQSRIITETTLGGGETGCFVMSANIPRSLVRRVETTTSFDFGTTERLKGKIRLPGGLLLQPDFFGDLQVSGRLRNAGNRLTYFNEINLDVVTRLDASLIVIRPL